MSDNMTPVPFGEQLSQILTEYRSRGTILGIRPETERTSIPIGPAAGPHTQLCGNIVAAYAAGAIYFELKTVQILEGKELGIKKPCIYVSQEVYNTEWSSELTVKEAETEYINAYLILQILSRELSFLDAHAVSFVMSVGYDMKGIRSEKIDQFLDHMQHAEQTAVWQENFTFLKGNLQLFEKVKLSDLQEIEANSCISNTVTLSTMHGCPKEEIFEIAQYLLCEKRLNTYIKLNPTLIGKTRAQELLAQNGCADIVFDEDQFEIDLKLEDAAKIITDCMQRSREMGLLFGVKLTNTFPVKICGNELAGESMYMSGPALYALAVSCAYLLEQVVGNQIKISYSGGADDRNIAGLIGAGISPVSVTSILLRPGGYSHLSRMKKAAEGVSIPEFLDEDKLRGLMESVEETKASVVKKPVTAPKDDYQSTCAKCRCCVDVCPNRANVRITIDNISYVLHKDRLCNECGNCRYSCVMGHIPYQEKFTIFESREDFDTSSNPGGLVMSDYENKRIAADIRGCEISKEMAQSFIEELRQSGYL